MPLLPVVLLFIVVPVVELYVILQIGDAIGAPLTIVLLAADSAVGAVLLRSQGRSVWRQFNEVMRAGRVPHRELLDGVAVIFGGALLLTPGFITDVVGLLLLLPPSRALIRRLIARRVGRRFGMIEP
ncbi:MAG: FxsA family protein [Thermoleophilaceae bacterium]